MVGTGLISVPWMSRFARLAKAFYINNMININNHIIENLPFWFLCPYFSQISFYFVCGVSNPVRRVSKVFAIRTHLECRNIFKVGIKEVKLVKCPL